MPWNEFFLFRWQNRYQLHTSKYYFALIQTRGVCILWAGPDHHASHYKSVIQLLIMKSSSLFCEPIYSIHTHMLSRVWALHEWAATWFPATELYIYMSYQGWAIWAIKWTDHLHVHVCLPGVSYHILYYSCDLISRDRAIYIHELPGVSYMSN